MAAAPAPLTIVGKRASGESVDLLPYVGPNANERLCGAEDSGGGLRKPPGAGSCDAEHNPAHFGVLAKVADLHGDIDGRSRLTVR